MTKFNKRVLALAIAGAVALPGVASAATLAYDGNKQITFAKDLIVNDGTTIFTPANLLLSAETTDTGAATVLAGELLRVKVTLTNGARFDTTADASNLVAQFTEGDQTGGGGGALNLGPIDPYYSTSGQELNFEYFATANGTVGGADYWLELNSMQITNLVQGLFTGSAVGAEITVQKNDGQQILASTAVIARSAWGITATTLDSAQTAKRIDVANCPNATPATSNRTRFSPNGDVGGSCVGGPTTTLFNVGGVELDITRAARTNAGSATYINNFSAVAANPEFNVVNTATWTFTVTGSDLSAFTGGDIFLASNDDCTGTTIPGTIATGNASASFTVPATSALVSNLGSVNVDKSEEVWVCVRGDDADKMLPQTLAGAGSVNYNLVTQRVNPPAFAFDLLPLLLNGTTITFQNINPAGNTRAQSFLRLTNHNNFECPIVIDAKDDAGVYTEDSDNVIRYTLAPQASWTINSEVLENGSADVDGAFGDGQGRWYVRVTAECANVIGSALNRNLDTGVVTNLTPERNNDQNLFGR